jgi:hypothetical protein
MDYLGWNLLKKHGYRVGFFKRINKLYIYTILEKCHFIATGKLFKLLDMALRDHDRPMGNETHLNKFLRDIHPLLTNICGIPHPPYHISAGYPATVKKFLWDILSPPNKFLRDILHLLTNFCGISRPS